MRIIGILHSVKLVACGKAEPGESIFTTSGVFTVPKGIKEIEIFCVGGGAGGSNMLNSGAGGGGGYTKTGKINVVKNEAISVNIASWAEYNACGNNTSVKSVSAAGGQIVCADRYDSVVGGNGGSGGGGGAGGSSQCGNGGSDGSDGAIGSFWSYTGGVGQHTTTRAFGESTGTLYAGGGGGGSRAQGIPSGAGGAGGGGNGSCCNRFVSGAGYIQDYGQSGGTNTGGGGGGGWGNGMLAGCCRGGSGIAIIRW